jgi:hypothetical protein
LLLSKRQAQAAGHDVSIQGRSDQVISSAEKIASYLPVSIRAAPVLN